MNTKSSPCKYCGEAQHTTEEEKDECGGLCEKEGCFELLEYCSHCGNEKLEHCKAHLVDYEDPPFICSDCEDLRYTCESCFETKYDHPDQPRCEIMLGKGSERRSYYICSRCRDRM